MSGLSNASAAAGFMQGFHFVEGVQDRQTQRARQEEADKIAREDREYLLSERDYLQSERDQAAARRTTLQGREDTQWNQQQGEYKEKLAERFNTKLDQLALALEADPNYDWQNDPRFSAFAKAGPTMEGLMSGQTALESPEVGAILAEMSPDLFEQSEVSGDLDGSAFVTRGKQPGTLVIGVRKKDGTIVPKTERQSTAEDDPIRQYPVDGFMKRGMAYAKAGEYLQDPQARKAWLQSRGKLPKLETDKNAGEYERLLAMRAKFKPDSQEYKDIDKRLRKLTHIDGDNDVQVEFITDEMGVKTPVERLPNGTWRFVDPGQAPSAMREEAASWAQDKIDDMAGLTSTDATDFKQFGGNRDRAYEYFYNQKLNDLATQNANRMGAINGGGGLEDATPSSAPQPPESEAPTVGNEQWSALGEDKQQEALSRLQKNPAAAPWFEKTFGYLPEGFEQPQTADAQQAAAERGLPQVPRPGGEFQWQTEQEADKAEQQQRAEEAKKASKSTYGLGGPAGIREMSEKAAKMDQEASINRAYTKFKEGASRGVIRLTPQEIQGLLDSGKLNEEEARQAQSMLADLQRREPGLS